MTLVVGSKAPVPAWKANDVTGMPRGNNHGNAGVTGHSDADYQKQIVVTFNS